MKILKILLILTGIIIVLSCKKDDPLIGQPTAAFTISTDTAYVGEYVFFDASKSTGADRYRWDFDVKGTDSWTFYSPYPDADHQYNEPGLYKIRLEASNSLNGHSDREQDYLIVIKEVD